MIKMILAFNLFFLAHASIYPQKQYNIDSLIKIDGIYEEVGDKKLPSVVGVYELNSYKKRFLGTLVDGKKHGTWKEFHPNKRVLVENYKNGKLDGSVSLFYKNGQKEWSYKYSNGILNGSYSRWYANGKKSTNGYFENGGPVGLWAWWDKNGVITKKQHYPPKTIGITRGHNQYTDKLILVK